MANSRFKILIPMLALCFFAVSAYGQAVLALGSNPTRVRAEGITEVVGLITLSNNTNANQTIPGGTTITITFPGNVTNDPGIATTCTTGNAACGVALRDRNVYTTGTQNGGSSQLAGVGVATPVAITTSGPNVTLSIPTGFTNANNTGCNTANVLCIVPGGSLNIEGVRVNVSGSTGDLLATITPTPANAVTFPGGQNATVVGRAQPTIGSVSVFQAQSVPQCTFPATPTLNSSFQVSTSGPNPGFPGGTQNQFFVNVREPSNFPTAFSAANSNGSGGVAIGNAFFFDEGSINTVPTAFPATGGITPGGTGVAPSGVGGGTGFQGSTNGVQTGVRLVLSFSGLPANVSLVAAQQYLTGGGPTSSSNPTGNAIAPNQLELTLVKPDGTFGVGTANTFFIPTNQSGSAALIFEVTRTGSSGASAAPTTVDTATLGFWITGASGQTIPVGSLGTVQASVGPVSSTTSFSRTAGTLRFASNAGVPDTGVSIGTATACLTNLLFPFVSNLAGSTFNTGLAISNTALDAGTTKGDTGGITLYFYGVAEPTGGRAGIAMPILAVSAGGTASANGVVAPGEHTVLALNDGTATAIAAGFQGYIVALCNFRFAHGLATVFDNFGVGAANVGFSYLPVVISGSVPGARLGRNNGAASTNGAGTLGETLGH